MVSVLDCLERQALITPEESMSLALDRPSVNGLLKVLQQKPVEFIDAVVDALAPFQDNNILIPLKCMSCILHAE